MSVVRNRALRAILFGVGVVALGLGVVGAFLPLLPTTPFVLLAAGCFVKSSPRAHAWLYRQPVIGESLRLWERERSIAWSKKVLAVGMISASVAWIWMKSSRPELKIPLTVLLSLVSLFLLTRKSPAKRDEKSRLAE
ncbi:MAG: YbaN family protein [Bdellovibrionales bacterium]|nr:YbaN family protein [Bdellovibrionales bacterium]